MHWRASRVSGLISKNSQRKSSTVIKIFSVPVHIVFNFKFIDEWSRLNRYRLYLGNSGHYVQYID